MLLANRMYRTIYTCSLITSFFLLSPISIGAQREKDVYCSDSVNILFQENSLVDWKQGFVLAFDNGRHPLVLAYGDNRSFPSGRLPVHIKQWIDCYRDFIIPTDNYEPVSAWLEASKTDAPTIEPLLKSTCWGQDYPYNLKCPIIEGRNCPSGCVATALAQIMRFYNYPQKGRGGIVNYYTKTNKIPITFDFDAVSFEWGNIYDIYDSLTRDSEPIATLLQAVGAAVEMDYTLGGSGSSEQKVLKGLPQYLGYDQDMFVAEPNEYTDEQWHRLIQKELLEGRPVYYSGKGVGSGHAFVIDGVKTDKQTGLTYYHINWGWDGLCNGYYLLNILRPTKAGTGGTSGTNYGLQPSMIIGLKPDDGIDNPPYMHCKSLDLHSQEIYAGQNLSLRISRLVLRSSSDYKGSMTVMMRNLEQPGMEAIALYEEENRSVTIDRGLTNYCIPTCIPLDVPSGQYQLELSFGGVNGEQIHVETESWPVLTVKDDILWSGGHQMQPRQYVAAKGISVNCEASNEGMVCFMIDSLCCVSSSSAVGVMALIVCHADSSFIAPLREQASLSIRGYGIVRNYTVGGCLSRKIPDGLYLLGIGFLPYGSEQWSYVYDMKSGDDVWWNGNDPMLKEMIVESGTISIEGVRFEGADSPWHESIDEVAMSKTIDDGVYDLNGNYRGSGSRTYLPPGLYLRRSAGRYVKILQK